MFLLFVGSWLVVLAAAVVCVLVLALCLALDALECACMALWSSWAVMNWTAWTGYALLLAWDCAGCFCLAVFPL